MKIDEIRPVEKNPRRIDPAALQKLQESIQRDPEFMRLRPIVVDGTGAIIGGNQRWRACRALGMKTIPDEWVVRAADLTDEQRRRFILVDNGPDGMTGTWDWEELSQGWSLQELTVLGFDPPDQGEEKDPQDTSVTIDAAEQLRVKWGVELGQLWEIGPHRILCDSCTDPDNWKRLMRGEKAVLCNTDPPYGVSWSGVDGSKQWDTIQGDHKREDSLLAELLVPSLRLACQHTTDDAAFYIWHASATRRDFEKALDTVGIQEKQYITWVKDVFVMGHADYHWQTEPAFYANKSGQACRWYGGRDQATLWRIRPPAPAGMAASIANGLRLSDGAGNQLFISGKAPKAKKTRLIRLNQGETLEVAVENTADAWEFARDSAKERLHPTQKPVRLFMVPIGNHTEPGDLVIEPFAGGGGQFVAANRTGRRCYGMDLDPRYVAVVLERLSQEGITGTKEPNDTQKPTRGKDRKRT